MNEAVQQTSGLFAGGIIARLLNITERRLQKLAQEGIVPKAARGQYPLAGCVRGYIKYLQNSGGGSEGTDPEQLEPFKRKAHYQAELDKLKLQEQRRELVPRIEAEREMAVMLKIAAETFDTLPDILERDCGMSADALAKMETLLDKTRESMYQRLMTEDIGSADSVPGECG